MATLFRSRVKTKLDPLRTVNRTLLPIESIHRFATGFNSRNSESLRETTAESLLEHETQKKSSVARFIVVFSASSGDESLRYFRFVRSTDSRPSHFVNSGLLLLANSTKYC